MYAQTQTFLPRDHGRSIVQFPSYLSSRSLYINSALGGKPRALAHMLDSLVRVSRRVDKRHFVKGPTTARRQNWPIQVQKPFPRHHGSSTRKKHKYSSINTASHRFLFSNFRYSFTLFSKFFASFPHGTCSLSVSHLYLALDGIYHPLRAAIPSNSTRRK